MRSAILALVGLVVGALAALGYSHFLGEGKQASDLQDQVTKLQSDLASAKSTNSLAKQENDALAGQVQQLIVSRDKLKKQLDSGGANGPSGAAAPNLSAMFGGKDMSGMIKAQTEQRNNEKLQMLISRLHLTPDQIEKIKAAMDAEAKRTEEMTAKMFAGQKVDFQSMVKDAKGFQSADQVLQSLLTPEQKTAYQQMQTDEKTSAAESLASMQMNQVAPLLNLSESQKDQVESALYQVQMDSEDPAWIKKNASNVTGNPIALLDVQEKAKEDALSSILSPDQMATYKQQAQAQLNMQKTMMQKFMPAGGLPSASTGATGSAAATVSGSPAPATATSTGP
jgi:hypothetical protein